MKHNRPISHVSLPLFGALLAAGCSSEGPSIAETSQALTAECVPMDVELAPGDWSCGEELTVECTSGSGREEVGALYVPLDTNASCEDTSFSVSDEGPFAPGDHIIVVTDEAAEGAPEVCEATLHVTDTSVPAVEAKTVSLWPPNHKLHAINVADCAVATDACDGELSGEFIWASSDEPINDIGDGNHEPDIVIDSCGQVSVRAERQGPKDGRVYRLGVRFVDGAGNATEAECAVIVDHDKRGVMGADSGEAYRITLDGTDGAPVCDGVADDPEDPADDGEEDAGDDDNDSSDEGDPDTGEGDPDTGEGDPDTGEGDPDTGVDDGTVSPD